MEMKKEIYLIADPEMEFELLIRKVEQALAAKAYAVQLWDNWKATNDAEGTIREVYRLTRSAGVPLYLNQGQRFLHLDCFDGIHLDVPCDKIETIRNERPGLLWGLTCSNTKEELVWAEQNKLEYISFCSVFPSQTSTSCELITVETIQNAPEYFSGKIFLAGGINRQTLNKLKGLPFDGIALVSAIMNADDPEKEMKEYDKLLND
jgi:thiamine-phosphate pyrophosphorylase